MCCILLSTILWLKWYYVWGFLEGKNEHGWQKWPDLWMSFCETFPDWESLTKRHSWMIVLHCNSRCYNVTCYKLAPLCIWTFAYNFQRDWSNWCQGPGPGYIWHASLFVVLAGALREDSSRHVAKHQCNPGTFRRGGERGPVSLNAYEVVIETKISNYCGV